jgi:glycolate oxidase iron-sulfur subunit
VVESGAASVTAREHLDRCLTCRACEAACPSGVEYGRLVDVGRELVEQQTAAPRAAGQRFVRFALASVAARRGLFTPLLRAGQAVRSVLPPGLQSFVPPRETASAEAWPPPRHPRRMAVLAGCVQPGLAPQINAAAARVLDRLGISLVPADEIGCCGALQHHNGQAASALASVRRNLAAGLRLLDASTGGVESIVSTASGCGGVAKDYAHVLRNEGPTSVAQASRVSAATRDLCEVIDPVALTAVLASTAPVARTISTPRSLQCESPGRRPVHCSTDNAVRRPARSRRCCAWPGVSSCRCAIRRLCCGSAGAYSLLQPELSHELRARKLESLLGERPDVIATANIGCHEHLRQTSPVPVRHWIEIVDSVLAQPRQLSRHTS